MANTETLFLSVRVKEVNYVLQRNGFNALTLVNSIICSQSGPLLDPAY